jgi:hypothetical protein
VLAELIGLAEVRDHLARVVSNLDGRDLAIGKLLSEGRLENATL